MSDFPRAATDLIRRRAKIVQETGYDELVDLAAHLFAISSELLVKHRNVRMTHPRIRATPGYSVAEAVRNLAALPEGTSPTDLYWAAIDALMVLENEICRRYAEAEALRRSTFLEEIRIGEGGTPVLGGEVYHWIHPPSVLAVERENRYELARRPPPDPEPHPGFYLSRLGMYWRDPRLPDVGWFEPGDRTVLLVDESGRDASQLRSFRIALCPLAGDFHPLFEVWPEGHLFRAADPGMRGADALAEHLEKLMETAVEQSVHLLLLPELTIDPPARRGLEGLLGKERASLPPYGVVAGSFHLLEGGYDQPCANESVLLDRAGAPLSAHRKRGRFRFPSPFLQAAPGFFSRIHSEPAEEIFEDLQDGSELHVVETSLGRLALLICADAITADDKGYLPLLRHLRPDLVFVVAMSSETEPFDDFFKEMARYWVGTVFVNAHCIGRFARVPPKLAFCDLALYEEEGKPPTRIRWRYGADEPECIYYNPKDRNRDWRPLGQALGETGVSWLKRGDEVLGLVIDLGVHWPNQ